MTRDEELQAIENAVKSGKIHRLKPGESSNFDELPFRKRRAVAFKAYKKAQKITKK